MICKKAQLRRLLRQGLVEQGENWIASHFYLRKKCRVIVTVQISKREKGLENRLINSLAG